MAEKLESFYGLTTNNTIDFAKQAIGLDVFFIELNFQQTLERKLMSKLGRF